MTAEDTGFLSRWSRRKEQSKRGEVAELRDAGTGAAPAPPLDGQPLSHGPVDPQVERVAPAQSPAAEPLPTLADVARLSSESDFARFVAPGVDDSVKHAAMKKLFSDPHFNVMDGLDTYIDDYGKPDPIPLAMLRKMTQSKALRLFEDEEEDVDKIESPPTSNASTADLAPEPDAKHDDNADLQLQQDHAAGWTGPVEGAGT